MTNKIFTTAPALPQHLVHKTANDVNSSCSRLLPITTWLWRWHHQLPTTSTRTHVAPHQQKNPPHKTEKQETYDTGLAGGVEWSVLGDQLAHKHHQPSRPPSPHCLSPQRPLCATATSIATNIHSSHTEHVLHCTARHILCCCIQQGLSSTSLNITPPIHQAASKRTCRS
jgi:hypothetical protein